MTKRQIKEFLYHKQKGKCYWCNRVIKKMVWGVFTIVNYKMAFDKNGNLLDKNYNPPHLDHKIPKSKGGKNLIDNYVLSCSNCNLRKGNKIYE